MSRLLPGLCSFRQISDTYNSVMKITTPILKGVPGLKLTPELSREATKNLKWFKYYIIGDNSNESRDTSLRIEMGNTG